MENDGFAQLLFTDLARQGLSLSEQQIHLFSLHYELMKKWSKVHNLTSIGSIQNAVSHHYVDCIRGLSFLTPGEYVFDLGSGAGFPGLLAAVLWPQTTVNLVDSSRKKCSFLRTALASMRLSNVEVLQARIEELQNLSCAISRATFSLPFLNVAADSMALGGEPALWLSQEQESEISTRLPALGLSLKNRFFYGSDAFGKREILLLGKGL